ncbi:hypothetical protein PFISCL1PPCAC_26120, partial [Pristionchus fissidentatus]
MWENSTNDDLLRLSDEDTGLFTFTRFRPNFTDCEKVVICSYLMWKGREPSAEIPTILISGAGRPVAIPFRITSKSSEEVPEKVFRAMTAIGEGSIPYPESSDEFLRQYWPDREEGEKEEIRKGIMELRS